MHWKGECEAIVASCFECQEPLYDLQDPETFHECRDALFKGIEKRKSRLQELNSEKDELHSKIDFNAAKMPIVKKSKKEQKNEKIKQLIKMLQGLPRERAQTVLAQMNHVVAA